MSERFESYYFGLDATCVKSIDEILKAVTRAGSSSHHTDSWADKVEWYDNRSPVDWIQEAANTAAAKLKIATDALREMAEVGWMVEGIYRDQWDGLEAKAREALAQIEEEGK
jgi:hypothetical protein